MNETLVNLLSVHTRQIDEINIETLIYQIYDFNQQSSDWSESIDVPNHPETNPCSAN